MYRFLLRGEWVLAVVGVDPGEEPRRHIDRELSRGRRVTLEDEVLGFLVERREQGIQEGPWVERHFRPDPGFGFDR